MAQVHLFAVGMCQNHVVSDDYAILCRNCTRLPSLCFKFWTYFSLVAGLLPFLWRHIRTVFIEDVLFIHNYVTTLKKFFVILQPLEKQTLQWRSLCTRWSSAREPEPSDTKVSPDIHVLVLKSCILRIQDRSTVNDSIMKELMCNYKGLAFITESVDSIHRNNTDTQYMWPAMEKPTTRGKHWIYVTWVQSSMSICELWSRALLLTRITPECVELLLCNVRFLYAYFQAIVWRCTEPEVLRVQNLRAL